MKRSAAWSLCCSREEVEELAGLFAWWTLDLEERGQDGRGGRVCPLARVAGALLEYAEQSRQPRTAVEADYFERGVFGAVETAVAFWLRDGDGSDRMLSAGESSNADLYALAALLLSRIVESLRRAGEGEVARTVFGILRACVKEEGRLRRRAAGL